MAQTHRHFERDWETNQVWEIERGSMGTKIRRLVSGPRKADTASQKNLSESELRAAEAKVKENPIDRAKAEVPLMGPTSFHQPVIKLACEIPDFLSDCMRDLVGPLTR